MELKFSQKYKTVQKAFITLDMDGASRTLPRALNLPARRARRAIARRARRARRAIVRHPTRPTATHSARAPAYDCATPALA